MYRSLPPRHLALLWIPAIALFWTAIVPASSTAKCTPTCAASGWQKHAQGMYLISGSRSPAEPFRLVGFGSALANAAISCPPAENPSIWDAQAIWQDFRFYGSSPALGLFRGEIDREKVSSLTLQSLSSVGLFPAAFTNDLFLRLTPLALPSLEYRNPEIMRMQAVVHQAPPELSMVGLQVNPQDVFEATSPVPGTPEAIVLTDSRQTFLPSGCLTAERLPATGDALRIRVGYPGERAVKAAYFLHGQGTDPAAFARLDGIVAIPAGGTADIEMSLTGISAGSAIFDAIVLEPFDVDCAARLTVALLTGPDETPPVCRVQRFITGPPTRLEIFVQDGESGLDSIEVQESMNAAVDVPLFAQGTNAALIVVGTKIDQSTSSRIELKVTDLAGNVTLC
ncbi:MAG TPA: hypothetical protein VLE27_06650, partial [Thermoanaerobaculia bacterium]|nr:hypothetical protein [Thermoanaerobaculia bacterium]